MNQPSKFVVENNSRIEPWFIEHICKPVLNVIPRFVTPNSISLINHLTCWMVFFLAVVAPYLSPLSALWTRILVAFFIFASGVLDCLDGMQARRTGRCSKLGEVMDHWLDALNLPLMSSALIVTLQLDPLIMALGIISGVMVYNAQLIHYHHSGRFVHPKTAGIDAQLMLVGSFLLFSVFLYIFPRELYWVTVLVNVFGLVATIVQVRITYFYLKMFEGYLSRFILFLFFCAAYSIPYLMGMMSDWMYLVGIAFISFRITGSYVLYTVIGQRYNGSDWRIGLWALAILITYTWFGSYKIYEYALSSILPFLFFLHLMGLNLLDLYRNIGELRPQEAGRIKTRNP